MGLSHNELIVDFTNIDDVFCLLRKRKIEKVAVDFEEMFVIIRFLVESSRAAYDEENKINWDALHIMMEGKIDKFFGVELVMRE